MGPGVSGGIGVKAAIDLSALGDQRGKPEGIGPSASGGDTAVLRVEGKATESIDGGFAKDDLGKRGGGNGEEAKIFSGTGRHPAPGARRGPAQFGADGLVLFSPQQENGMGSGVGVEGAGLNERIDQGRRQGSLMDQIKPHAPQLGRIGRGQGQRGFGQGGIGWRKEGSLESVVRATGPPL